MIPPRLRQGLHLLGSFLTTWQKWIFAVVLILGLAGRVLLALKEHPERSLQNLDDGIEYLAQAKSILHGSLDGHPTLFAFVRAPGYSLFLAPFEWLTPQEGREWVPSDKFNLNPPVRISTVMFRAIQLVQCLLSAAAAVLVGRIAQRMAGTVAGLIAFALIALNPFVMVFSGMILSETLFLFLLWLSIHELMRYAESANASRWWTLASASVALAAGCLCRPNLMAALPSCALWVGWIEWRRSGRPFPPFAAMTAMTLMVSSLLLPLMIRNRIVHGELNLSPFYATAVLAQGHSPHYLEALSATNQEDYNRHLNQLFLQSRKDSPIPRSAWLDEPRRFFHESRSEWWRLQWLKTKSFWRPWLNPTVFSPAKVLLSAVAVVPIFIGAFGAFLIPSIRNHPLFPLLWAIALTSYLIGGVVFTASTRFRIPFMDVSFMIMTAGACAVILERCSGSSIPGTPPLREPQPTGRPR